MGKGKSIQQELLGKLDSCMQSNEARTHPHTTHKNKLKIEQTCGCQEGGGSGMDWESGVDRRKLLPLE